MRHIFDPSNGRLPNRTSKLVTGGTEAQEPIKALENLNGIDIDLIGQPDGILGLDDTGGLYFENANLNTLFPVPQVKGPGSVYVNHKAHYLITNYDYNKAYTLTPIGNGQATLSKNTVTYTAPSEPTVEGDGFTVNGVDFPITVMEITVINQVLEPSIIVPNTPTIEYSALKYRFESTEFRYTGVTQHHISSSWEIATDINFTNIVTSVTDSASFKTTWELLDTETTVLLKNTDYYIRVKHTGDVTGSSTWSSFIKFQIKEEFQTELPYVKKPSVISYLPSSTSIVHPPFILYGGDGQDPNSMSTNRSLQLITDGYASACSLNNSAIVNTVQHRKNPYANYPSAGMLYGVGVTVNAMEAVGNELWFVGNGIAKYNPVTDTVSELSLGEIAISSVYGLTNVCQHGENLYAIGKDLDYILQYYDGPIPEFRPMARHGLPIQQYSGVTVSNNVAYAVSRTVGLYKKPNGSNDFQLVVSNNSDWSSVTIVDGTVYATVLGGDIYKYNDTNQTLEALNQGNRYWTGITAKGTDVYACVRNGYIYKQTNGTGNFVAITSDSQYWGSIYSDGIDVYATTDYNSDVYIQRNGIGPFFSLTQIQYAWTDSITLDNGDTYGCLSSGDIYVRKSGELYFKPLNQTPRAWDSLTALGSDVYACVYGGDIYKQTNGVGNFAPLNQTTRNWSGLATVDTAVYASVENGDIYKLDTTQQFGTILSVSLAQRLGSETYVFTLIYLGNGVVLAGTGNTGQVYRSTDNGLSFTLVQRLGSETTVRSLLSLGNGVVLAGTGDTGQIYRSTDNGLSFTLVQRLESQLLVQSLLSLGNGVVLAGTGFTSKVYRSTDYGLSFTLVQQLGTEEFVQSLAYLGNGIVLAGTSPSGKIYRSTDNGLSFTLVQQLLNVSQIWTILPLGNGLIIVSTSSSGQIYRSTDNGLSFTSVQSLGSESWVGGIVSANNNVLLAGTYPNGQVYRINYADGSFLPLNQTQRQWKGITYHGTDVYAIDYATGIYKQTNATGDFTLLTSGSNFKDIVTVGTNVYISVHNGSIYKKTGSGDFLSLSQTARQWNAVFSDGSDVYATAWQSVSGVFKYVLYKQTNGTGDFVAVATSNNLSFTSVSKLGDDIYATTGYAIYKKLPNETTFNEVAVVNEGGSDTNTSINHLYMNDSTVYVATTTTLHSSTTGLANLAPVGQTRAWWADICSSNGNLYAAEASMGVHLVNTTDGTLINLHDSSPIAGSYSSLESLNNKLYFTAGHIYAETATPNVFDVVDNTQSNFIELAASDDHMFVRTSDSFIYKQANGTGTFDLVVSDLSEITSMAVLNNVLYTHVNWVNNYIPVQNGIGRYDMSGAPIYDSKTSLAPVFYTHSLISSSFESVGGPQDHVSSSWQIASDAGFHNVVYEVNGDTVYKTAVNFSGLIPNTNYHARIKHTGSIWGDSVWSDAFPFSFGYFNIPNDDFYDQILSDRSTDLLGAVKHSTAANASGTVVAISMTEIQYEGFVDSDAIVVIYRKDSNTWVRDGEFVLTGKHQYGLSMAMNSAGNKLFVGAPFYGNSGAVFLYERDEIEWTEGNIFEDPIGGGDEGGGSECFGACVACNALGNRVAIGRTAVNDGYYAGILTDGSVYVYDKQLDGFWGAPTTIVANDPQPDSGFGASLSMSDDGYMLVIGAPNHNFRLGKVYVLYYEDSSWGIAQTLSPHDTSLDVAFGHSVSLSGDGTVLYVGAPDYDDERNPNNILTNSGSVYAYKKDSLQQTWYLYRQWIHYTTDEHFGKSVSTNTDGSMLAIATDYKTFVYQRANDQYLLNTVEPTRDIDPTTFGRIYTKTSSISGSGTCLVQSLKYSDAFYNNYIHIKTLGVFTPQNHIGTDWQIASDREFTNILVNVTNDTQQKEVYESPAIFPMRTAYFVRARYNSENLGYTQWSLPMAVTTMGGE